MIDIAVIDLTAEARRQLYTLLSALIEQLPSQAQFIPRISIRPLSLQEIKFRSAPDICVIGPELIERDLPQINLLKIQMPQVALIAMPRELREGIISIDNLARVGIHDVIAPDIDAENFLKRIILLARHRPSTKSGTLILVDGGKGGVGTTSVAAGMAESLIDQGKTVLLVDLDFETQDLSRFLQVRPFVNEALQLIIKRQRAVTEEFVNQAIYPVWGDCENLKCMPPVSDSDDIHGNDAAHTKTFMALFELLDECHDCVIVDLASARGALRRLLYRICDKVVLVVNNDPASLYASVERIRSVKSQIPHDSQLILCENASTRHGLSSNLLRSEINRSTNGENNNWFAPKIPFCPSASKWPGSGGTIFSQANKTAVTSLISLSCLLGLSEAEEPSSNVLAKLGVRTIASRMSLQWKRLSFGRVTKSSQKEPISLLGESAEFLSLPQPEALTKASLAKLETKAAVQDNSQLSSSTAELTEYDPQSFITRVGVG